MSEFKRAHTAPRLGGGDQVKYVNKTMISLPGNLEKEHKLRSNTTMNNGALTMRFHREYLANKPKMNVQAPIAAPALLARYRPPIPTPTIGSGSASRKKLLMDRFGKPLVHQPVLKPTLPPKKPPLAPPILARLKYSRCLRATILLNNAKKEKQLANHCKMMHILYLVVNGVRKGQRRLFLLKLRNQKLFQLISEMKDADLIQRMCEAIIECSEKEDALEMLRTLIVAKFDVLPVRNSDINESIPTSVLKDMAMSLNWEIYKKYGTPMVAVIADENLMIADDALETTIAEKKAVQKLINRLKIMLSMKILNRDGIRDVFEDFGDESISLELSFTDVPALVQNQSVSMTGAIVNESDIESLCNDMSSITLGNSTLTLQGADDEDDSDEFGIILDQHGNRTIVNIWTLLNQN